MRSAGTATGLPWRSWTRRCGRTTSCGTRRPSFRSERGDGLWYCSCTGRRGEPRVCRGGAGPSGIGTVSYSGYHTASRDRYFHSPVRYYGWNFITLSPPTVPAAFVVNIRFLFRPEWPIPAPPTHDHTLSNDQLHPNPPQNKQLDKSIREKNILEERWGSFAISPNDTHTQKQNDTLRHRTTDNININIHGGEYGGEHGGSLTSLRRTGTSLLPRVAATSHQPPQPS